jgi:hypothetical protein
VITFEQRNAVSSLTNGNSQPNPSLPLISSVIYKKAKKRPFLFLLIFEFVAVETFYFILPLFN